MVFMLELLILLQTYFCSCGGDGSDLPGHMQPLGSHRPPIMIKRIQHLLTPAEFHRDYVTPKVPVVMEGALNGATVWKKWQSDEYLREAVGDEEVIVEQGKKENRSDPTFTIKVKEFLDRYEKEDIYLAAEMPPPLHQEWELPRPVLCEKLLDNIMLTNIWLSSGGTNSVLHTDSFENLHCLVSGVKRFTMFEPNYSQAIGPEHKEKGYYDVDVERVNMTKYPELSWIPWYLAEVNEGDCLYLPHLWIHNVKSFSHNLGTNIWWSKFDYKESDCPSDDKLPDYLPLGTVMEQFPELEFIIDFLDAESVDKELNADSLFTTFSELGLVKSLDSVKLFFEQLQPGCNGKIKRFNEVSRKNLMKAYKFMVEDEWNISVFEKLTEVEAESSVDPVSAETEDGAKLGDLDSHDEL